ncbi:hypothetical protein [Sphingobium sp. SCG-1]|uniref:hypothetical protein n=1 Tax=Sphingobium sp. SCG-1 TaxID=2072936 RepID=UPI0011AB815A|nr:hypothetical protein [Sphingobium sp. SCG-1]
MSPNSFDEQELLKEILALTFYEVTHATESEMADMHMQPQQCHNNVAACIALDPSGSSRTVAGWWKRGDVFLFHSVVLSQSRLLCVTPIADRTPLDFAPDPLIEWHDINGSKVARRLGKKVPYIVRLHPEDTIQAARDARQALIGNADPE